MKSVVLLGGNMGKKAKKVAAPIVTLDGALYDVEARFILPMTTEDINRSDRLFFQVEQAHWFYEAIIRLSCDVLL